MPSANSPAFNVPIVDIGPYISNPSSLEAQKVVDQVREACTTSGFFALVGHGIPESLQDAVFKGAEKFFALPFEEKNKIDKKFSLGASNRGYEVLGGQALEAGKMPDLKEGFYAGQDIPADDPRTIAGRFYMGPNVWPPTSLIPESEFKEPVTEYYTKMHALSLLVLEVLARGLPYGPNVFDEFVSNDAVAAIRILHYPPQTSEDKNQLGAGAHTDFGAITLLLQDGTPGLQVWNHVDEEWLSVPPTRGAYVVNVGDMLSKWTSGLYKSNLHRVLNKSSKDRYSIPFFFDGNLDCPLAPFDGSAVEGEVLTVEGHMNERFATTFGRGKEGAKH